ncbi:MAG: hypothetical protein K5872_12540 [Rhizobiaceae bacterium]|nr:hypothetical protein [Rhizobiaceae bacterium]MCV0407044.1 hypothetical protein [Rhizobiaceae bacterium]
MTARVAACGAAVAVVAGLTAPVSANERDRKFFDQVQGEWTGPGEIVAGKYKGTKFTCNFKGATAGKDIGMSLDGGCRVGLFNQKMSASFKRGGKGYTGTFMDGAVGKGLDIVGGQVQGSKVTLALHRNDLHGAMLARMASEDTMNVTVSVRVDRKLVPVIGMSLKRIDGAAVGAVARD